MYRRYYNPYDAYPRQMQNSEHNQIIKTKSIDHSEPEAKSDTYTSYNDNAQDSSKESPPVINKPEIIIPEKVVKENTHSSAVTNSIFGGFNFLNRLKRDDIILIALILLFFLDGIEDEGILIILIALLIMGFMDL